jgi:hypothetical protein
MDVAHGQRLGGSTAGRIDLPNPAGFIDFFTADPGPPRSATPTTIHNRSVQHELVMQYLTLPIESNGSNAAFNVHPLLALGMRLDFGIGHVDPPALIAAGIVRCGKGRSRVGQRVKGHGRFLSIGVRNHFVSPG